VTIRFLNSHTFEDNAKNGIIMVPLTGFLSAFEYIDPYWSIQLDGIADYLIVVLGFLIGGNVVASTYFGASTTPLWTTVAYIQMITMVPLLAVNWPNFVDTFFGKLGQSFNLELYTIPNVIFDNLIAPPGTKILLESPLNARYAQYKREYSNFFYLAGRKIIIWLGLLMSYPIVWYMKRQYADKHKFCRVWEKLELRYRHILVLRLLLLSYVSLLLATTLNIYKLEMVSIITTASCFVSIALQICMIYLPILIMNVL
jgi:hypothetical protein